MDMALIHRIADKAADVQRKQGIVRICRPNRVTFQYPSSTIEVSDPELTGAFHLELSVQLTKQLMEYEEQIRNLVSPAPRQFDEADFPDPEQEQS
jgi:hypothetical protein